MKISLKIILFFWLIPLSFIYSQVATVSSGGYIQHNSGSVSYSIGQTFVKSNTGTQGNVSEGIQKSFEIFTLSNNTSSYITLNIKTFPNPTSDFLNIHIKNLPINNLTYKLFTFNGKIIKKGSITQENTVVNIQSLSTGIYLLKINENIKQLKTFKIIKY